MNLKKCRQILWEDHLKFNNFLQCGHRKKVNPKIMSIIIRNIDT